MGVKKTKREEKKQEESRLVKEKSVLRKRVARASYLLAKTVRRKFGKGGSPHDVFFHLMMKNVKFAVRFLKAYLPRKLLKALDLSDPNKIKILSTDFYDARIKKHIADLIFVVPCKEENEFVSLTLIVEHKAQSGAAVDPKTIAQVLRYVALEVDEQLKNLPEGSIIYQPLVVIFYTGSDPDFEVPSWENSFPLPKLLRVKELRDAQIRFKPVCVNLTRLFLDDKISQEDFLQVMVAAMVLSSLKRLRPACPTMFRSLGKLKNWTDEDRERLNACFNYIVMTAEQQLTEEELDSLRLSSSNEKAREDMKTILDLIEERGEARGKLEGEIKGEIKGKIQAVQMVTSVRFQETSTRLTSLLTKLKKLNDLKLLDKTCQYVQIAPSLSDLENFVENLMQVKPKTKRVLKKRVAA